MEKNNNARPVCIHCAHYYRAQRYCNFACEEVAPLHTCNQIVHKTGPQCFTAFIPAKL